ncbi:LysR family transcriptional regulator [Cerasibacillus terrae]|uniref:LysR family transcriptional regulator n=1 Tax=Cerasibacillus terrae TaxID=2498845 RepID=A0A5C8NPI7_9BACI|nr:LysR family transcriptional regulator [Cerasibacillus terrae]TXL63694.1 LysR family transcriptional regulator [Cerasibacillus terrae]
MDQQLQVFVTVAEKKNFTRAAEKLHMTQPAVSQYIRQLEEEIGTRLLERTNKYVRLNKAGEIVYHHAKEILGIYTKMQHLVDDLIHQTKGSLSIGASFTFGEYVLPQLIAQLRHTYPDIQASVLIGNTAKIADLVMAHQLDIGIVEGAFEGKQLKERKFAKDAMYIIASANHVLVKQEKVTQADLEKEMWIIREQGSGTREATISMLQDIGISPKEQMTFSSTQSIKQAVEAGLGITLLSKWAVQKELKAGDLKIIFVQGLPFYRSFSIITRSPFQTKALEVFVTLLENNDLYQSYYS